MESERASVWGTLESVIDQSTDCSLSVYSREVFTVFKRRIFFFLKITNKLKWSRSFSCKPEEEPWLPRAVLLVELNHSGRTGWLNRSGLQGIFTDFLKQIGFCVCARTCVCTKVTSSGCIRRVWQHIPWPLWLISQHKDSLKFLPLKPQGTWRVTQILLRGTENASSQKSDWKPVSFREVQTHLRFGEIRKVRECRWCVSLFLHLLLMYCVLTGEMNDLRGLVSGGLYGWKWRIFPASSLPQTVSKKV